MKKKSLLTVGLCALAFVTLGAHAAPQILPVPKAIQSSGGSLPLPDSIVTTSEFLPQAKALASALQKLTGTELTVSEEAQEGAIELKKADGFQPEEYLIDTRKDFALSATTTTGIARATSTFLQLLERRADEQWQVSQVQIKDSPDFGFRSFLTDMGRNPHSPETLRRIVDTMWLAKTRYLHLHLTDDQLFSFPSTAYPKLISENAGWTLEDWHEIEAYSQARGVTIIPELEAPGHSEILRKVYPEVFGKTATDLATLDSAYEGLTVILLEMMDVFKATPYIHIGCDEAFGVEEKFQRALVNRLHAFLTEQGRETIVWEGPREGKGDERVHKDVIHMNWRCIEFPAPDMIAAGHRVIHANWDPNYVVDHYPRTMFTAVSTEKCYQSDLTSFKHINHDFATYHDPATIEKSDQLLGFCMAWWEGREENVIPLCRQRLTALTARAWNDKGEDSFESFLARDIKLEKLLEILRPYEGSAPTGGWPDRMEDATEGNLAHGKMVSVSAGASQPLFHPQRLTNGATDRFDHFLGFPTKPKALDIVIDLGKVEKVSKVDIYEAAVNGSWESYEVALSTDNRKFKTIGETEKGSRGETNKVSHLCDEVSARYVRIRTNGCEDLTFPSFSRLCEVMVFGSED